MNWLILNQRVLYIHKLTLCCVKFPINHHQIWVVINKTSVQGLRLPRILHSIFIFILLNTLIKNNLFEIREIKFQAIYQKTIISLHWLIKLLLLFLINIQIFQSFINNRFTLIDFNFLAAKHPNILNRYVVISININHIKKFDKFLGGK